jgi:hypothetical protein
MHLPETMRHMRYTEWNHAVKGLVEVWELARLLGLERSLEAQLANDDGTLALHLGKLGNEFLHVGALMRRSAVALTLAHSACLLDALGAPEGGEILAATGQMALAAA